MTTRLIALAIVLALLTPAAIAWGQTDAPADPPSDWQLAPAGQTTAAPDPGTLSILDLLGKLTIAILAAWGLAHGVRWLQQHKGLRPTIGSPAAGRAMVLEESLALGADGRLHLVTVDGQRILLAAREGSVQRIELRRDDAPPGTAVYRAMTKHREQPVDELNIGHKPISTHAIRSDVVTDTETWSERRDQLLRQLQEA